jgi:hypothetical protein
MRKHNICPLGHKVNQFFAEFRSKNAIFRSSSNAENCIMSMVALCYSWNSYPQRRARFQPNRAAKSIEILLW